MSQENHPFYEMAYRELLNCRVPPDIAVTGAKSFDRWIKKSIQNDPESIGPVVASWLPNVVRIWTSGWVNGTKDERSYLSLDPESAT